MATTRRYDPMRDLCAWAQALISLAELQRAIQEETRDYVLEDHRNNAPWIEPYRALVKGAMRYVPERFKEAERYENAIGLNATATQALQEFKREARQHRGVPEETIPEEWGFQVRLTRHPIVKDEHGVLRYKVNTAIKECWHLLDVQELRKSYRAGVVSRDDLMQLYRDMGYSLQGFQDAWEDELAAMQAESDI